MKKLRLKQDVKDLIVFTAITWVIILVGVILINARIEQTQKNIVAETTISENR